VKSKCSQVIKSLTAYRDCWSLAYTDLLSCDNLFFALRQARVLHNRRLTLVAKVSACTDQAVGEQHCTAEEEACTSDQVDNEMGQSFCGNELVTKETT